MRRLQSRMHHEPETRSTSGSMKGESEMTTSDCTGAGQPDDLEQIVLAQEEHGQSARTVGGEVAAEELARALEVGAQRPLGVALHLLQLLLALVEQRADRRRARRRRGELGRLEVQVEADRLPAVRRLRPGEPAQSVPIEIVCLHGGLIPRPSGEKPSDGRVRVQPIPGRRTVARRTQGAGDRRGLRHRPGDGVRAGGARRGGRDQPRRRRLDSARDGGRDRRRGRPRRAGPDGRLAGGGRRARLQAKRSTAWAASTCS